MEASGRSFLTFVKLALRFQNFDSSDSRKEFCQLHRNSDNKMLILQMCASIFYGIKYCK